MSKFKSLLYREMVLSKKKTITQIITVFSIIGIGLLCILSMKYGNLNKMYDEIGAEMNNLIKYTLHYTFVVLPALAFAFSINDTTFVSSDIRSNWRTFSFTTPVKPAHKALVRVVIKLINMLFGGIVITLNSFIMSELNDIKGSTSMILKLYLIFLAVGQLIECVPCYFKFRARTIKEMYIGDFAGVLIYVLMGVLAYLLCYEKFSDEEFVPLLLLPKFVDMLDSTWIWALLVNFVMLFVNYYISCHAMNRRYD